MFFPGDSLAIKYTINGYLKHTEIYVIDGHRDCYNYFMVSYANT